MKPQARLPSINAREPKPSDKCKQLAAKAQAILGHTPNIAGKDSKSLFPVLKPPQAAAYDASALKGVGVDLAALKGTGFDAAALKGAGFDLSSLVRAGFDCSSLVKAGFNAASLKGAGFSIRDIAFKGGSPDYCVVS